MIDFFPALIGLAAYALAFWGLAHPDDRTTRLFIGFSALANAVYVSTFGMWITSAILVMTAARMFCSIWYRHHTVGTLFLLLAVLVGWMVPGDDYLGWAAGVLGVIAAFWMDGVRMRVTTSTSTPLMTIEP